MGNESLSTLESVTKLGKRIDIPVLMIDWGSRPGQFG